MLIILYIIAAAAFLIDIPPFKIAGIFIGICYLPGFTLFAFLKRDPLEIEEFILAFPVSIGISSLLTLGLLYSGIHVRVISYLIFGITVLVAVFCTLICKNSSSFSVKLTRSEIRFLVIAFLVTLLFSIPVISERIAISAHGFHHLSIITSISNGIFPPENPGLGGTTISYHWGYHTLVAALSYPTDLHPLRVFSVLNIMSLFFIVCVAYSFAKYFGFSEGYSYLVPLALVGLMRSDAGIYFVQKLFSGNFPPVKDIASAPLNILTSWVWGVSYLDTRLFFMSKFYNANNMPLGICFIFSFFLILLLLSDGKKKNSHGNMYLNILSLILIGLAITYAFFLIIPLIFVPIWTGVIFLTNSGNYREKFRESFKTILPCIIAALLVTPYLLVITSGKSVITAGKSLSEVGFIYLNIQVIKNLIVFLLPSPIIIYGMWIAFKRYAGSRKLYFLLLGTVTCLTLSVFLRLQWYNSAKFSFILSFFFSILFVLTLMRLLKLFTNQWLKKGSAVCIVVYLLATPVITEAAYIYSPWFYDTTYTFRGRHVVFARDKERNDAYAWIRDNTPLDSLLMLPYLDTPYGITIAQVISYRPVALSERSLFVVKDIYAIVNPEYEGRVRIRNQFFENPQNTKVKQYITSLNRPVYLLVEEGYEDPLMEGVEVDQVPEDPGKEIKLVFNNDKQRVYRIQYKT